MSDDDLANASSEEPILLGERHPRSAHLLRMPTRATEVPETQAAFRTWAQHCDRLEPVLEVPEEVRSALDPLNTFLKHLFQLASTGTCYWVTTNMVQLLEVAAPNFPLRGDTPQLPSESGFLLLAGPMRVNLGMSTMMRGFVWAENTASALLSHERPSDPIERYVESTSNLVPLSGFDAEELVGSHPTMRTMYQLMATCVTLMQQRIAVTREETPDRPTRRRISRLGGDSERRVVVIDLRRPTSTGATTSTSAVDWKQRWIVGGHWRNQWLPSEGTHQPMWIAPYIKGPDDKPLVIHPRVYRWSK